MDDDKKRIKVISLIIALVIIILSVIIVVVILSNKTDYEKLEKEMVAIAKEKVETQNIEVKIQNFMNLEALNITDGAELCSKASGVIITNINGRLEYKAYLKCVDYESNILKNNEKYIKLKGSAVVLANKNAMYFDEGYEQIDNDITVEKVGTVINEPGAYTINYVIKKNNKQKTIVKRIIIVSDVDVNIQSEIINKDTPTITLKGEKEMYLTINSEYVEPGYSAYDYKDGKISNAIEVSGSVDTTKTGTNKITYTVKNSQGKIYSIDRIIHVVKEIADLDISISAEEKGSTTNKSLITLTVTGNGFSKIILPNGAENPFSTASYEVTKNGVYTFVVVDIHNNRINKSIVVDNIDNIAPTGTCSVKNNNNGVYEFNVIGEDESGISAVNYIIDDKESGFLATTVYQTKEKVSKASVILQDVAGNQTKVSCSVTD